MVKRIASALGTAVATLLLLAGSALVTLYIVETDNKTENLLFITQPQAQFAHGFIVSTLTDHRQDIESGRMLHPELLPTLLLRNEEGYGRGGAVCVAPGLVVTAAHCVADGDVVRLEWQGRLWVGVVVFRDPKRDVAIIAVPGGGDLPMVIMQDGREDQLACSLGYPYGQQYGNVVTGYLGPSYDAARQFASLPTYPGCSGCGVYDAHGQLLGLCNAVSSLRSGLLPPYTHVCLITPSSAVRDALRDWRNFGRVRND